jgi:hypothetical protein
MKEKKQQVYIITFLRTLTYTHARDLSWEKKPNQNEK